MAATSCSGPGTALALVGTQVDILPLQLFALVSDAGTDLPRAAALALILTALCSLVLTAGEIVATGRKPGHP